MRNSAIYEKIKLKFNNALSFLNFLKSAELDECLSNPCNPIGTEECIDFDSKFVCKCRTGYSGALCEGKLFSKKFALSYSSTREL